MPTCAPPSADTPASRLQFRGRCHDIPAGEPAPPSVCVLFLHGLCRAVWARPRPLPLPEGARGWSPAEPCRGRTCLSRGPLAVPVPFPWKCPWWLPPALGKSRLDTGKIDKRPRRCSGSIVVGAALPRALGHTDCIRVQISTAVSLPCLPMAAGISPFVIWRN